MDYLTLIDTTNDDFLKLSQSLTEEFSDKKSRLELDFCDRVQSLRERNYIELGEIFFCLEEDIKTAMSVRLWMLTGEKWLIEVERGSNLTFAVRVSSGSSPEDLYADYDSVVISLKPNLFKSIRQAAYILKSRLGYS